jgi:hypothetical protein
VEEEATLSALEDSVAGADAAAAEVRTDLERARVQLRQAAMAAFISGGPTETVELLSASDLLVISQRRTYFGESVVTMDEAIGELRRLEADATPKLVESARQLDRQRQRVINLRDSVLAARATEAEAERVQAAELARRKQQEAAEKAAARAATTITTTTTAKPASGSPTTRPASEVVSSTTVRVTTTTTPSDEVVPLTSLSAPLPALPDFGPTEESWAALRKCESGGNYRAVSSSGLYRGAYQFDRSTWAQMGGVGDPAAALPVEQDARAKLLFTIRGARPWPVCGRQLVMA